MASATCSLRTLKPVMDKALASCPEVARAAVPVNPPMPLAAVVAATRVSATAQVFGMG